MECHLGTEKNEAALYVLTRKVFHRDIWLGGKGKGQNGEHGVKIMF